jgi:phage-related minor tail protein
MSKRSSSPHGLGNITPEDLRGLNYTLKPKKLTWSQWLRLSKAPDNEYDEEDLEKARIDLATNQEKKAALFKLLEEKTRDSAAEQNLRDFLKKEKADQAIAAATELRSKQQEKADKRPIGSADPEEDERTEYYGAPIHMRELKSFGIGPGAWHPINNPRGRGGKSKRVKSRRVKSKRNKHRNTRK